MRLAEEVRPLLRVGLVRAAPVAVGPAGADLLEIPNLGTRSNQYIGYLAQRYAIGNEDAEFVLSDPGEGRWLVSYGLASFAYRIYITFKIALFVAGKFFFVGVVIAFWAIVGLLVVPLVRMVRTVVNNRELYRRRGRILTAADRRLKDWEGSFLYICLPTWA